MILTNNKISHFPLSFGTPTQSLVEVNLWNAYSNKVRPSILYPFFSEFINLKTLNLGENGHHHFNASLLPVNLTKINLGFAHLIEFPDFISHAPNLKSLNMYSNLLRKIPDAFQKGMVKLNSLRLSDAYICVGNLTIISSDNSLSPGRRQAITWTSAGLLLIGPLGTNFSEILIDILTFLFKKMRLKVSSAKRRPFFHVLFRF